MPLRQHRGDVVNAAELAANGALTRQSSTRLKPWRVVDTWEVRWAIGATVRSCRWQHDLLRASSGAHVLWLTDPQSGPWASAHYDGSPGPRPVRQSWAA
jgi:hypothetical protein